MFMKAEERRQAILRMLQDSHSAVSATSLSHRFEVSRQIIVGDIALLRAQGAQIVATPRGYIMGGPKQRCSDTVACIHNSDRMEEELQIMVDNGCYVENVIVEHPVYGQLIGQLNLSDRSDVAEFLRLVSRTNAPPLSELTGGIHLHHLRADSPDAFERVRKQLKDRGFLFGQ